MKKYKKHFVLLSVLLALIASTVVVSAITIIIDGVQDPVWTTGAGTQLPGSASDFNEGLVTNDGVDIATFRYTNDGTYFYILIETHANTTWSFAGPDPFMVICFNTDNNPATPGGSDDYGNCDGSTSVSMDGIERIVEITGGAGNLTANLYLGDFITLLGSVTGPPDIATQNNITELRIPLTALGFNSITCAGAFQIGVYLDGVTTDPDDNTPDTGTLTANCGDPTAVSLQTFGAGQNNTGMVVGLIGALLLGLLSTGYLLVRRQALPVKNR